MQQFIKLVLSTLFFTSLFFDLQGMHFLTNIPIENCKLWIQEHPIISLGMSSCLITTIMYFLYHKQSSNPSPNKPTKTSDVIKTKDKNKENLDPTNTTDLNKEKQNPRNSLIIDIPFLMNTELAHAYRRYWWKHSQDGKNLLQLCTSNEARISYIKQLRAHDKILEVLSKCNRKLELPPSLDELWSHLRQGYMSLSTISLTTDTRYYITSLLINLYKRSFTFDDISFPQNAHQDKNQITKSEKETSEYKLLDALWKWLREPYLIYYRLFNANHSYLYGTLHDFSVARLDEFAEKYPSCATKLLINSNYAKKNLLSSICTNISRKIGFFLMCLHNKDSVNYHDPTDQLAHKLLNYTIYLHNRVKPWLLPPKGECTHDKKYYVVYNQNHSDKKIITIYDYHTKEIIAEIENVTQYLLYEDRNIILLQQWISGKEEYCIYELDSKKKYGICSSTKFPKLSHNKKYLIGYESSVIWLCNMENLDNLDKSYTKITCKNVWDFALSPDNKLIAASTYDATSMMVFLYQVDDPSEVIACYHRDVPEFYYIEFAGDGEYLILTPPVQSSKKGHMHLQLIHNNKQSISLRPCFTPEFNISTSHINNKYCIYSQDRTEYTVQALHIVSPKGETIYTRQKCDPWNITVSKDKKHIFVCHNNGFVNGSTQYTILHMSSDYQSVYQQDISFVENSETIPTGTHFNAQNTFFLQKEETFKRHTRMIIRDQNGNRVTSLDDSLVKYYEESPLHSQNTFFHGNGNCVVCNNEVHELYPRGALQRWQNKVSAMTTAQYFAAESIASLVKVHANNHEADISVLLKKDAVSLEL